MKDTSYIADLHIHSLYSRATSKASNIPGLACWAAIKGIQVVGTGDFTHPGWLAHLIENLEPAEPGFFRLKHPPSFTELASILPPGVQPDTSGVRFILSSEISSIYKKGGKVRKIHNILYAPDFDSVRRINSTLSGIGNLEADGRPILGLDSRILLEILLEHAPDGFLVPAHIWTPWFSLFGSKSGFDAIEECFGDLSNEIFAMETGLSSDPEMNRCISALDRFSLISNSDCHSPSKLGREANIFCTGFDFFSMREAIRHPLSKGGEQRFTATIEFYPEEGKYHCDGHRKCGVCLEPHQTVKHRGVCPQCGRPVTIGVLYRVMELADRDKPVYLQGSPAVHSLIPLPEVLGELFNVGPASKKVAGVYGKLINEFGSEFNLLLNTPVNDLSTASPLLGEAVSRIRQNQVIRKPGFDGEFGVIRVFAEDERAAFGGQLSLFGITPAKPRKKRKKTKPVFSQNKAARHKDIPKRLNTEQLAAVKSNADCIVVQAGPGTGKTHTLVARAHRLLAENKGPVAIITFTNKAVEEIRQRLTTPGQDKQGICVDTFHSFCLHWLRSTFPDIQLVGPEMRLSLCKQVFPHLVAQERKVILHTISLFLSAQYRLPAEFPDAFSPYFEVLKKNNQLDLDGVIPACTALMHDDKSFLLKVQAAAAHLLVDEFQDLNAGQFELVRLLGTSSHIFAIGDPNQAIYGFRGSNPEWFTRFIDEHRPEQHYLVKNYRSGAVIIEAAEKVINAGKVLENTVPAVAAGRHEGVIYSYQAAHAGAEAIFIAQQVQALVGGTTHREIDQLGSRIGKSFSLSDIAVLYRTGRQAEAIANALEKCSIPFQVVDVIPFYMSGDARVVYYFLLLTAGMIDKAELLFLLRQEKGIGIRSIDRVDTLIPDNSSDPLAELHERLDILPDKIKEKIFEFRDLSIQCQMKAEKESVASAVTLLIRHLQMNSEDRDLIRLQTISTSAESVRSFAEHLRGGQGSVVYDDRAESVLLATLHAAKGLEFEAVFLTGCEEGLLPLTPRGIGFEAGVQQHVEEERRLFFVGMTRAARVLYLTGAKKRMSFTENKEHTWSRFLKDIPGDLISALPERTVKKRKKPNARQLRLF